MFTTKTRTALAVTAAALGVAAAAVPAQAAAPTRPPAFRLQGAATTVTIFRPAGTRNVYLRARTIKRPVNGTIVRNVNRIPIWVTVTKPIILDGRVVTRVSCGATGQGASQATCDRYANAIQSWVDGALEEYVAGNNQEGYAASQNAAALANQALDHGCFVTGINAVQ